MTMLHERVRRHRDNLRQRGLRPIQIWVPDTRAPGFAEEAGRQAVSINAADQADGVMSWLEDVSMFDEPDDAAG